LQKKTLVTSASHRYLDQTDLPDIDTPLHEVGIPAQCAYQRLMGVCDDAIAEVFSYYYPDDINDQPSLLICAGILYGDNRDVLDMKEVVDLAYAYGVDISQSRSTIVVDIKSLQSFFYIRRSLYRRRTPILLMGLIQ